MYLQLIAFHKRNDCFPVLLRHMYPRVEVDPKLEDWCRQQKLMYIYVRKNRDGGTKKLFYKNELTA
jgi:hypothetical protein